MSFFIQDAWAQSAPAAGGVAGLVQMAPLVILFVVFWFFLIRPQMKRQKEHRQMIGALSKGDECVTNGGLAGRVTEMGDNFLSLEIAKGVEVKVQKQAIATVLPKGTLKSL